MSGDIFFLALVFVTLLHQFFRFRGRFPVLATSPRLSQTADTRRSRGGWGAVGGQGDVFGRLRSD